MAATTWNFPCHQTTDWGPDGLPTVARCQYGHSYATNPYSAPHPFSTQFTAIFAVLFRTGWSHDNSNYAAGQPVQSVATINGVPAATGDHIAIYFNQYPMHLVFDIGRAGVGLRHRLELGDEDGVNWIQMDKWYQVGLSWNTSGISWCVNGTTSPTMVADPFNNPGTVPGLLQPGGYTNDEKFTIYQVAKRNTNPSHFFTGWGWPTYVAGPFAFSDLYLDFNSQSVRDNIWDANGDFIYPGANGLDWWGGLAVPEYYLHDGTIAEGQFHTGLFGDASGGTPRLQGGLRKDYE